MNIIIDTHASLYALSEPFKISKTKISALEDLSNTIFVSAISVAEPMIKASIEKLKIDFDPAGMAEESGFSLLDFSASAATLLKEMPFYHKDPFDRMSIAQSITTGYPIMTDDPKIAKHACQVL